MSLPITKLVQQGGNKKSCGCPSGCGCGKTPAKQAAYPKDLKDKIRNAGSREEKQEIMDRYTDSVYTKYINDGNTLSPNRTKILEKVKQRLRAQSQESSPLDKKSCGSRKKYGI